MKIRYDMLFVGLFFLIVGGMTTWAFWFNPIPDSNSILLLIPALGGPAMFLCSAFPFIYMFEDEKGATYS